jgi:hypothetical protein
LQHFAEEALSSHVVCRYHHGEHLELVSVPDKHAASLLPKQRLLEEWNDRKDILGRGLGS